MDDTWPPPFPEPTRPRADRTEVLLGYLDHFRGRVISTVAALGPGDQRSSRLPSAWTPVELVKHLRYVELRWMEWGFEGRATTDPWGDQHEGRWVVADDEPVADLLTALAAQGTTTSAIARAHALEDVGQPGPRWDGEPPATLERVLLHLLQEYARHVGHLDVVAELAGLPSGE